MVRLAHGYCRELRTEFLTLSHDVRHVRLTDALAPMMAWRNQAVVLWRDVIDCGMSDGSIQSGVDPDIMIWILFYSITGSSGTYAPASSIRLEPKTRSLP